MSEVGQYVVCKLTDGSTCAGYVYARDPEIASLALVELAPSSAAPVISRAFLIPLVSIVSMDSACGGGFPFWLGCFLVDSSRVLSR